MCRFTNTVVCESTSDASDGRRGNGSDRRLSRRQCRFGRRCRASGVVYAVDETGAARIRYDDTTTVESTEREASAPDPLTAGDFVAALV